MANPRRGEVDVEIGGETFTLVYDFNAISELESRFNDRPVNELFMSASGAVPARVIREALRIGMEKKNGRRTPNDIGKMIGKAMDNDPEAYLKIVKAVTEGVFGAFGVTGQKDEEQAKEAAPAPRPTEAAADTSTGAA